AEAWQSLGFPYPTGYARCRQAEALLASAAPRNQVTAIITDAWQTTSTIGARRLTAELESLARRARIQLHPASTQPDKADDLPEAGDEFRLTPREREVLALVANGRTNRQIAETLFITNNTASVHVPYILAKLDVPNRSHAA